MTDKLGDLQSSENLIRDLYIELRSRVGYWSEITFQTPQARMGYIGQHLVSVVTGFPGGRSGARGKDLVIPGEGSAEIKTCYRVDQLGSCRICKSAVSSLETECSECGSVDLVRKDDSKWLLSVKTDNDFAQLLEPISYFFVLFEFEDLADVKNQNIIAQIWEVDPNSPGFLLCMVDYKLNIQPNSKSGAPFNLWPYSLKFALMKPKLIYKSRVLQDRVETLIFPGARGKPITIPLPTIDEICRTKTWTDDVMASFLIDNGVDRVSAMKKSEKARKFQEISKVLGQDAFTDSLVQNIYKPLLVGRLKALPEKLRPSVVAALGN